MGGGAGTAIWRWLRHRVWPSGGLIVLDLWLSVLIFSSASAILYTGDWGPAVRVVGGVTVAVMAASLWTRRFRPQAAAAVGMVAVAVNGAVVTWLIVDVPDVDGWQLGDEGNGHLLLFLAVVLFTVAVHTPWRRSRWFLLSAAVITTIPAVAGVPLDREPSWELHVSTVVVLGLVHAVALAVRRRRCHIARIEDRAQQLADQLDAETRAAVAEERLRISRELHDIVAHHVSVMTVQVAAAEATLDSRPDEARGALAAARAGGREALDGMRSLVGALREVPGPDRPTGLSGVPDLVRALDEIGLRVRVDEVGARRELPALIDLAAYRVVQEALTNVLRHARTATADLSLQWGADALTLHVRDRGLGGRGDPPDGAGHGLTGMRERVAAAGGTLRAGPRAVAGFEVEAVLPYRVPEPDDPRYRRATPVGTPPGAAGSSRKRTADVPT